jgi:hypothetical protein
MGYPLDPGAKFLPLIKAHVMVAFGRMAGVYYDYERTSTPAGILPSGNSFQMALLEPNRVSTVFSYQQNMVDCINLGHHFPKGNCRHFDPGLVEI